jgi:glucose dehydrogenase
MYVHTPFPNTVYALNLKDENKIVWKYESKQDPNAIPVMCCDTVNRGVSYGDGKIFLHQADTTLVALDAKTGKVIWSVKNGDPSKGETGTSSPSVSEGRSAMMKPMLRSASATAALARMRVRYLLLCCRR